MGNVIVISNRDPKPIEEVILGLKMKGLSLVDDNYKEVFSSEGQVIFEFVSATLHFKIHVGKKSYYIDFDRIWESFLCSVRENLELYNYVLEIMDVLGRFDQVLLLNSEETFTVYDNVCEGFSLEDITGIKSIQGMISNVNDEGLKKEYINVFDMRFPEYII